MGIKNRKSTSTMSEFTTLLLKESKRLTVHFLSTPNFKIRVILSVVPQILVIYEACKIIWNEMIFSRYLFVSMKAQNVDPILRLLKVSTSPIYTKALNIIILYLKCVFMYVDTLVDIIINLPIPPLFSI